MSTKLTLLASFDPLVWIIDKSAKSILDLGCGQGKPMQFIKTRIHPDHIVGVELFKPYINEIKKEKIHDKYIIEDVRKVKFPSESFDIVLASHVIEHLSKKEAWDVVRNMERMAKKQVIIATPIGECYQPMVKGNKLEEHKSAFLPEEFEKRGYKTVRYGWRWLLDEHSQGLMYKVTNPALKKLLYLFNIVMTPVYYLFPSTCDYTFVAYKQVIRK